MPSTTSAESSLDVRSLAAELGARVRGRVRFDRGSRALYATDASNYRQVPIGVVVPRDRDDVLAAVEVARRYGAPILPRGGGTSLAGQCCNVAVVLDCSQFLREVLEIDPERRLARVQPGTVLDDLRQRAEQHHLTFAPDPSTHDRCTLGGMIGNNSCGVHSIMGGKTVDNVEWLDVVTADGEVLRVGPTSEDELAAIIAGGGRRAEIYERLRQIRDQYGDEIRARFPRIPRRVSGYNLDQLLPEHGFHVARALVGTEGTCVTVLEAGLRLVPSPPCRVLAVLGFGDVYQAADAVPAVLETGPIGLEGMDDELVRHTRDMGIFPEAIQLLPEGGGWLIAEYGADTEEEAAAAAQRVVDDWGRREGCTPRLVQDREVQHMIWNVREAGLGVTAHPRGGSRTWPGWEDSAVAPDKLGEYLRKFRKLLDSYGYHGSLYGHFGDGCLHVRIDFDLERQAGIERFVSFTDEAADLVVSLGGSLSGEHGDGQARGALLPKMFGPELMNAFREFKLAWDPENRMNPGKVPAAEARDAHLRLGAGFNPWQPGTHFQFPEERGQGFLGAALRCVGVGKCRREGGGTMCPSFMVTREEQHSTRGRARLLYEMLQRDVIGTHRWRDRAVREALDLCLACKGCKGECPVKVDMASYKAEFLSHYYAGRLRPLNAYAFGFIYRWARLARHAPRLVNTLTHAPVLRRLARWLVGMHQAREVPRFAPVTFTDWFARREGRRGGSRVLLWPDTFTNAFHPEIGRAAVEVLERAGFEVVLPREWVCCGRPLYDYGFLRAARRRIRHTVEVLEPELDAGTAIVGLEPSCLSVFRDDAGNLMPEDPGVGQLARSAFTLGEFLAREGYHPPHLDGAVLLHGHCHEKALLGLGAEQRILESVGLDVRLPDTGCCGMAGGFGFERRHYAVSTACAERVLLPAVREAGTDTLLVADGFSCREQIRQMSGRQALHLAQVLWMAGHPEASGPRVPALADHREL